MESKNKIIQIIGVPGSGKDRLTEALAGEVKTNYMNFSSIMADCAGQLSINLESQDFESLDRKIRDKIVADSLDFVIKNQPIIINTHTVYRNKHGLLEINYASEFVLNPLAYIHLFSPPEHIVGRIRKDNQSEKRTRNYHTHEISLMQDLSIYSTKRIAELIGSKFFLLRNYDGDISETVRAGRSIIESLL